MGIMATTTPDAPNPIGSALAPYWNLGGIPSFGQGGSLLSTLQSGMGQNSFGAPVASGSAAQTTPAPSTPTGPSAGLTRPPGTEGMTFVPLSTPIPARATTQGSTPTAAPTQTGGGPSGAGTDLNTALALVSRLTGLANRVPSLANTLSNAGSLGGNAGGQPAGFSLNDLSTLGALGSVGGSVFSLLSQLTGDSGLGQAGNVLGSLSGLSTIASIAPFVTGAAELPEITSLLSVLNTNPYTAMVAAAIAQIMSLYGNISRDASAENTIADFLLAPIPVVGSIVTPIIDKAFMPSEDWMKFPSEVGQTAGLESQALKALMEGLPYVQSQSQLSDLIGAFRNTVGQRVGGYGEGADPFTIPALPEVGPRTHGVATTPTDFASIVPGTQNLINALRSILPATATGSAADPLMRDFTQFLNRRDVAPTEVLTNDPIALAAYQRYPGQFAAGNQIYLQGGPAYDSGQPYTPQTVQYGDPGYDYEASHFPAPGQFFGSISPYWTQLGLPNVIPRYTGPQVSGGPLPTAPAAGPSGWVLNDQAQGPVGGYTYVTNPAPAAPLTDAERYAAFGPGGAGFSAP